MKKFYLSSLFIFFFTFLAITISAKEPPKPINTKPTVNLLYASTGFGLERDAKILTKELKALGYSVQPFRVRTKKKIRQADINVFLQEINENHLSSAKKNYLIPNPEWYFNDLELIPKMDMILCKTRECERIFKEYHSKTVFLGFTSLDRYDPNVQMNYRQALHLAGKSYQKGTDSVVEAWELNPHLPGLTLYRHEGRIDYPPLYNVQAYRCYLPDNELIKIQNSYGLHLCPSETEGFGQYLFEALSCGAIPITTDAPPMNEFITDTRCLAAYTHTGSQFLATTYYVDPIDLGNVVSQLMLLSDDELAKIGKKNRQFYLDSKRQFQEKVRKYFATNTKDATRKNK